MEPLIASVSSNSEPTGHRALYLLAAGGLSPGRPGDPHLCPRLLTTSEANTRCWFLGVHGGAGETSLAHLFAGAAAAAHRWPIDRQAPTRVVLVARTNFRGMTAAQAAMRDWSANHRLHVVVLGLVLIADRPGKLPRPLVDLQRDLEGATPQLWLLPWVERWTLGEIPSRENSPREQVEALRLGLTAALKVAGKERQDG